MSKFYAINVINAKPRDKDYKLSDGEGLYLLVKANGVKTWRMNFRLDDLQRTLTFGTWPAVRLAGARERRDAARKLLARGIDPVQDERRIKAEARRMRSVLSRVFRYGIATALADRDPADDLRGALIVPKVKHLAAITTSKGAGAIMRAIASYDGHLITRFALRLTPHLFVRPGELRKANGRSSTMTLRSGRSLPRR